MFLPAPLSIPLPGARPSMVPSVMRGVALFLGRSCGLLLVCAVATAQTAAPVPGGSAGARSSPSAAAPASAARGMPTPPALRHFLDHVSTFSAAFTQTRTDDTGKVVATQSGRMWLQRATSATAHGRFRWAYEKPYKQLIVCDGDRVWVYDPDLEQVTVRPATQVLAGSPAALLSQRTTLTDAFTVASAGEVAGEQVVKLTPRDSRSDFQSVSLSLRDGVPHRMVFRDQLGDATEVRFSDIKTNQHIDADRFQFKPPKGVTVVTAAPAEG